MKNIKKMTAVFLFTSSIAMATDHYPSFRELDTDYSIYESSMMEKGLRRSPLSSSVKYDETKLPEATSWTSIAVMQKRFEEMRDFRFLSSRRNPDVLRRASWNYPDDGCYARASLAMRNIFRWFIPMPNKVFVFGNLRVKTDNSPRGVVGWWYHVAPIVQVNGIKYVLDPAIEKSKPLPLKEWLARMGTPEKIKVAICGSGTYSPGDNCDKESDGLELRAERAQMSYLEQEWSRMVRLGRENEL
ncbi:MAG: hypothetical protein H0V66_12435 [Bdellovibrionales bacterium]|nr:hypothetical protein [Bdellovibrionales bacterium]